MSEDLEQKEIEHLLENREYGYEPSDVERIPLSDIKPDLMNANRHTERGTYQLKNSIEKFGFAEAGTLDANNKIIAGNNRTEVAVDVLDPENVRVIEHDGKTPIYIKLPHVDLETVEGRELAIALNRTTQVGIEFDPDMLRQLDDMGVELGDWFTDLELDDMGILSDEPEPAEDAGADVDRAAELQEQWQTETGQLWVLPSRDGKGEHRLLIGDCTDSEQIALLMKDDKAALVHADPPYGMGKEKDGIANDNLYRDKLDAFQMAWWNACRPHVEDNGSAYIWGNAESLWRLWYVGGLRDSERLTMRNMMTWDKANESGLYDGNGIGSEQGRHFAAIAEHCLFFMLGEQGFNNNADNYWEGWEPIREYLYKERIKAGWDIPTMKTLVGHSDKSRDHWTSKSQWNFPTEVVYTQLQKAANSDAFKKEYDELKKEYDELKKEFYATRAYFDNTHDNMTDVWQFPRVQGEDRHGHATPKPVEMMERVVKSSLPSGGICLVPFGGTAPELIACEQNGRYSRIVEMNPAYCAVILDRYTSTFGVSPYLSS